MDIVGEFGPSCILQAKPVPPDRYRAPASINDQEKAWRELRPNPKFAPIKQTGFVAPINSLEGIEHTIARIEAIKRMTNAQERDAATHRTLIESEKELATIADEFRANGFKALNLNMSSSHYDDDLFPDIEEDTRPTALLPSTSKGPLTDIERNAHRYGAAPAIGDHDILEAAPLMRRIEWERWLAACGLTTKVRLTMEGEQVSAVAEFVSTPLEVVKEMGMKLLKAAHPDWLEGAHRAEYAGFVGSALYGVKTGEQTPEQTFDNLLEEVIEEVIQGPQELGIQSYEFIGEDEAEDKYNAPPTSEPSDNEIESWSLDFERIDCWLQTA